MDISPEVGNFVIKPVLIGSAAYAANKLMPIGPNGAQIITLWGKRMDSSVVLFAGATVGSIVVELLHKYGLDHIPGSANRLSEPVTQVISVAALVGVQTAIFWAGNTQSLAGISMLTLLIEAFGASIVGQFIYDKWVEPLMITK
jgi:hypothetical protein